MILNKLKIKIFGGVYLCKMALIVTEYGKTAIVRSVTQDIPVNIKYIGIGAGNITLNSLTTDLVDVRYIGEISEYQISSVPDPDHPDGGHSSGTALCAGLSDQQRCPDV